jgi:hypothetical protein
LSALAVALLIAIGPAAAGEAEDCSGGQANACTRIIEEAGQPADSLAAAHRDRAVTYFLRNDTFREILRISPDDAHAAKALQDLGVEP